MQMGKGGVSAALNQMWEKQGKPVYDHFTNDLSGLMEFYVASQLAILKFVFIRAASNPNSDGCYNWRTPTVVYGFAIVSGYALVFFANQVTVESLHLRVLTQMSDQTPTPLPLDLESQSPRAQIERWSVYKYGAFILAELLAFALLVLYSVSQRPLC